MFKFTFDRLERRRRWEHAAGRRCGSIEEECRAAICYQQQQRHEQCIIQLKVTRGAYPLCACGYPLLFIFIYRRILCLCCLRFRETASHYLPPVISTISSPSTKAMKIYEFLFALTCIFPVATVASLNRVWVQYEDT
jgi:hypothetical protein